MTKPVGCLKIESVPHDSASHPTPPMQQPLCLARNAGA
jgi:hypothetical protein